VPTLLPWASFISTTVLAALASDQRTIVDDTAATKNRLCFMDTNYNQAASCALFDHRREVTATMQIRLTRRLLWRPNIPVLGWRLLFSIGYPPPPFGCKILKTMD
jgi:hypothetical protein